MDAPITVNFKIGIGTMGNIYHVIIRKENSEELELTKEQAISLAKQILSKYNEYTM